MTREQALKIYWSAKTIFVASKGVVIRREAQGIAETIEMYIGQIERIPARDWGT